MEAAQKGGYAHFMLKEIHEQPKVAQDLIHLLSASKPLSQVRRQKTSARAPVLRGMRHEPPRVRAFRLSVYLARLAGRPAARPRPQFIAQYSARARPQDVGVFVRQSWARTRTCSTPPSGQSPRCRHSAW